MGTDFLFYMSFSSLIALLVTYKYLVLFPLALVEGHIVSIVVGFLAHLGYINAFLAGVIIVCGNLTGDLVLYFLGLWKGESVLIRSGKYFGITEESVLKSKKIFTAHRGKILFFSKVTNGFGLAVAILFTAGTLRIPFRIFLFWNILGECVWTGMLLLFGFFFGKAYTSFENIFFQGVLIVFGLLFLFLLFRLLRYFSKRLQNKDF